MDFSLFFLRIDKKYFFGQYYSCIKLTIGPQIYFCTVLSFLSNDRLHFIFFKIDCSIRNSFDSKAAVLNLLQDNRSIFFQHYHFYPTIDCI